jgi:hypothetical protein
MVFATVPVCATLAMDRLLTFVGIGAAGLLALFWAFVFGPAGNASSPSWWRIPAKTLAWFFVAVHAILAPILLPIRAANPLGPRWIDERVSVHTPLGRSIADETLVIVNAPSPAHADYLIPRRELNGQPVPRHTRVLAPAMPSVTIRRLDKRTIAIRPERGYLNWFLDRVFRSERRPLKLHEQVNLSGMTVEVTALTADHRPAVANFRFDVPLESPSLRWLCYRGKRFEPFVPPALDQEIEIRFDWRAVLLPVPLEGWSPP